MNDVLLADCSEALKRSADDWHSGLYQTGLDTALHVLAKLPQGSSLLRAEANYWTSRHLCSLGNFARSVDCADAALAMCDEHLLIELRCSLLALQAFALSELGENARALKTARHGLALARTHDLLEHESIARIPVSLCLSRLGVSEEAELELLRALSLAREAHDSKEIFGALNQLMGASIAGCEQLQGTDQQIAMDLTLSRAKLYAQQAVAMAARAGHAARHANALNNLGQVLAFAGEWDRAESIFRRVAATAVTLNLPRLSMQNGYNLGAVLNSQGKFHDAEAELLRLLARLDTVDHPHLRTMCLIELERSCTGLGDDRSARDWQRRREQLTNAPNSVAGRAR